MSEKVRMRAPFLLAALFAFAGCSDAATQGEGARAEQQKASPAVYGAPRSAPAPNEQKKADNDDAVFGDGVLSYPDDLQMTMLAYRLTNREPPLEEWANEAQTVRQANEFSKAAALNEEIGRLREVYDSTQSIGFLQLRTSSQLSQYDSSKGGYYLTTFSPGRTFTFGQRERLSVQIENSDAAFLWPMDADAAQNVLAQTSRNVTIDMTVRLIGTERRSSGLTLKARITDYSIHSSRYNDERQLAAFSLE